MIAHLFDLPAIPAIPVTGESAAYPIGRIFCVGRNYAAHAAEMGHEVDREAPFYFTKSPANAILGGASIPYPPGTDDFHHEMELALAIGKPLFRATPERARDAVYAYGCALDMTRRDLQIRERTRQRPWDLGKDVENSAVFAPLTRLAGPGDLAGRRIHLKVDGAIRQDASLDDMVWTPAEIVAHVSGLYHLRPGDLILTGTPAGVGPVLPGSRISGAIDGFEPVELTIAADL